MAYGFWYSPEHTYYVESDRAPSGPHSFGYVCSADDNVHSYYAEGQPLEATSGGVVATWILVTPIEFLL